MKTIIKLSWIRTQEYGLHKLRIIFTELKVGGLQNNMNFLQKVSQMVENYVNRCKLTGFKKVTSSQKY